MARELRVGLFVVAGIGAIVTMLVVLRPGLLEREKYVTYRTELRDASGIVPRTKVKIRGIDVGEVESVELGDGRAQITIRVRADLAIPSGSTIATRTVGMLGDKYLEIVLPAQSEVSARDMALAKAA